MGARARPVRVTAWCAAADRAAADGERHPLPGAYGRAVAVSAERVWPVGRGLATVSALARRGRVGGGDAPPGGLGGQREQREDYPSLLLVDGQTIRGGRSRPGFHEAG